MVQRKLIGLFNCFITDAVNCEMADFFSA